MTQAHMEKRGPDHKIDDSLACPICLGTLNDPHMLIASGQSFCRQCLLSSMSMVGLEDINLHEIAVKSSPGPGKISRGACSLQREWQGQRSTAVLTPKLSTAERVVALKAYASAKDAQFAALDAANTRLTAALVTNGFQALVARLDEASSNGAMRYSLEEAQGLPGVTLTGVGGVFCRKNTRCNGHYLRAAALETCNGAPVWVNMADMAHKHYIYRDRLGTWVVTYNRAHFATNLGIMKSVTNSDLTPADVVGWQLHNGTNWVTNTRITSTAMTSRQAVAAASSLNARCTLQ